MSYKFLEHTSDIIIEAKNKTFETTLEDVAEGMFTQMGEALDKDSITITTKAPTKEQLVVDFLSDIIAECETVPFTPVKAELLKFEKQGDILSVTAKIHGEKKIPENIIKAVTYHELKVEENNGEWIITVLFDI